MHAAANNLRGGVSPRNTLRLRGQSIIEYVLIIAVIGLVIVFAGPGVAGAIRNQFSQVTNTVDSGTDGDNFISAEEKAYREAMKTVAQKEAKNWALVEQKAVATDIAKNGTSSVAYAKAEAAMKAKTKWSLKLTNGKIVTYRIIGINHDDLADGSGKAGLTFLTTSTDISSRMNATKANAGGWEKSELRAKMNSGEIWNLMPADFQSKVKAVTKMTANKGGGSVGIPPADTPSATTDKIFLLSMTEIYGNVQSDGTQYEFYKSKGVTTSNYSGASSYGQCWTRSMHPRSATDFCYVVNIGRWSNSIADGTRDVCPAWCF